MEGQVSGSGCSVGGDGAGGAGEDHSSRGKGCGTHQWLRNIVAGNGWWDLALLGDTWS